MTDDIGGYLIAYNRARLTLENAHQKNVEKYKCKEILHTIFIINQKVKTNVIIFLLIPYKIIRYNNKVYKLCYDYIIKKHKNKYTYIG